MRMAIDLARKGWGKTRPNPLVGSVIVRDDKVISQGYHAAYGGPHAEVNAIANLKENPAGSTIYVNLEPCSHYGKTPPCANALVKAGFRKAVIGMTDPNPLVSGRGIEILKSNGIEVTSGVLQQECIKLNEIFIKYITKKLPFVMIKSAMSLDGKIATFSGDSKWISNEESRLFVHNLRYRVSAIMVGINTVIRDNPSLTARVPGLDINDPIRIVVDPSGRIPLDAKVINSSKTAPLILAVSRKISDDKAKFLSNNNVKIIFCPSPNGRIDLHKLMENLYEMKIDSVLIEGGGHLNYSAIEAGIVDKVLMFISPLIVGGRDALTPFEGKGVEKINKAFSLRNIELKSFRDNILVEGYL